MANPMSGRSGKIGSGAAAAERRSGVPVFPPTRGRLLAGIGVVVLSVMAFFLAGGMESLGRGTAAASAAKPEKKPERVTIKRPLPPDVTEDQVPKWVPYRQASGRTELEAWDSVDAEIARDPYFRLDIMGPRKPKRSLPEPDTESLDDETSGSLEGLPDDEALDEETVTSGEMEDDEVGGRGPSTRPADEEVNWEPSAADAEPSVSTETAD